ncbi:MAG: cupin domain-containing protein [Actinomycetota bacterium]
MARRATPRPVYAQPQAITTDSVTRHLWGDAESGYVGDEVLLSTDTLHALIFTLPPGGSFGHSPDNRTVFAADEVYRVLEGTIAVIDPAAGQVVKATAGDCVFFRRDTWHHGVNWGTGPVRVLEYFSPPPATGASSAYAKTVPYLEQPVHADNSVLGVWPMDRTSIESKDALHLVQERDMRWRVEGAVQVGVVCSTEHLTVVDIEVLPGHASAVRRHQGDALLHVTEGEIHVHTPDAESATWWRVRSGESMAIPDGFGYRLVNQSGAPARLIGGSAPGYLRD